MKETVVVAMSGGVDSSVAAALLKKRGYEVIGITMCFSLADMKSKKPSCCGLEGVKDALRVAHKLGIRHYLLNMRKELEKEVIVDFCREYSAGRTPNPCVRCNQFLKFGVLLKKALSLGARYLATGHYAKIGKGLNSTLNAKRYTLKKAKDKKKDQSYFLYRLNQTQLKHILFPLGDYTKEEVRALARKNSLPVADKAESQEICFIPDNDYRAFLKKRINTGGLKPGLVIDRQGKVLGRHKGAAFYTIGQRQGLGVAAASPLYICAIEAKSNRITLGRREDVFTREFLLKDAHFIIKPAKNRIAARVRIRYNHRESPAEITIQGKKAMVRFKSPQFAVTPGQSAVFYSGDTLIGGAIIDKLIK